MPNYYRSILVILVLLGSWTSQAQHYRWINPPINIVILGSSTAAGYGVTEPDSSWVALYDNYLKSFHPENEVTNLAVPGYDTYHIMPNEFLPPAKRRKGDSLANISKALELDCDGIIVNLPSNDVYNRYSTKEQLDNFRTVARVARQANIPIWICTVQPRNFNRHDQRRQQAALNDSIRAIFANNHIDFWTSFATESHGVIKLYDTGDGCHLNDGGHALLANRVIESGAFNPFLVTSGVKVWVEKEIPRKPHTASFEFVGRVKTADQGVDNFIVQIVQNDEVISEVTIDSVKYSISGIIDVRYPFEVKFLGEGYLSKIALFDFSLLGNLPLIELDEKFSPMESLEFNMDLLTSLEQLPERNQIAMVEFKFTNKRKLSLNSDHLRVQNERLKFFKKPIKRGKVKRLDDNAVLSSKLSYKNGRLNGKCIWYYPNGEKQIQARFKRGEYDGKYTSYLKDGRVLHKKKFNNGILIFDYNIIKKSLKY